MSEFLIHSDEKDTVDVELYDIVGVNSCKAVGTFGLCRFSNNTVEIEMTDQEFSVGTWVVGEEFRIKISLPETFGVCTSAVVLEKIHKTDSEDRGSDCYSLRFHLASNDLSETRPWRNFVFQKVSQLKVCNIMSRRLIVVPPDFSVLKTIKKMARANVGSTLVCDSDRQLLGIFTERDFLNKAEDGVFKKTVREFMTSQISIVDVEASVETVYERFKTVHFRHLPVVENGRPVGIISIRDLTALWGQWLQLQKDKITSEYQAAMGVVVHDLRNPIFAIKAMNETLMSKIIGAEDYVDNGFPNMIDSSCEMMAQLIDDLLQISSIKTSDVSIQKKECDFVELARESVRLFGASAEKKSIEVSFLSEQDEVFIEVDRRRMLQAIQNLVSNAIKYSNNNSEVQVRIGIELDEVVFSVTDFGQGIAAEEIPKVFDEHCKISSTPTAGEPSTGLGLSIAKKIVEAHGGTIEVASCLGVETVFSIRLPKMRVIEAVA